LCNLLCDAFHFALGLRSHSNRRPTVW